MGSGDAVVTARMNDHSQTLFWIAILTQDHVQKCQAGGYLQADSKTAADFDALSKGDFVVFYAPRTKFRNGSPLQQFTALGVVIDDRAQGEVDGEEPLRRRLDFLPAQSASIVPLIPKLSFIPDKERWGLPFKRGLFQIKQPDFRVLSQAMGIEVEGFRK